MIFFWFSVAASFGIGILTGWRLKAADQLIDDAMALLSDADPCDS